ncbi:MAG: Crp/Fnr family transcriptional regulator [Pseudonocardiaceae bacterium]
MTITGHVGAARQAGAVTVRAAELVVNCLVNEATRALPGADVAALADHLVVRTLRPGQLVFAADQRPDGVWIVRSGAVELVVQTGRNPEKPQVMRDGDVFGDIPLLLDSVSPYYSRALRDTTCLWLAAQDFLWLLADRPAITRLWLHSCAVRYVDSQERLLRLLDGSLTQRTAALLLCEARAGVVALPQATLAAMVGSKRPSVNRVLRMFQQQGLITLNYGRLSILDEARLRRAAAGRGDQE